MEQQELMYRLAMSQINGIGPVRYKKMIEFAGSAKSIMTADGKFLRKTMGLNPKLAEMIRSFSDYALIEKEMAFTEKNNIQILCFDEHTYPQKLKLCADSPSVLFYKGTQVAQNKRVLSVIGTRSYTEYGKRICEELVQQLLPYDVCIVSGLAYGIDILTHKACIKNEVTTIGVLAHSLDSIYPYAHTGTAADMQLNGGLLSEYFSNTKPEKQNFPSRNRIVAGMSDATVVIETDIKGGSMITADIAYSYNRDVYCYPGKVSDVKSAGCNFLIKSLKAQLVTSGEDIATHLGWNTIVKKKTQQRQLFLDLSPIEEKIVHVLQEKSAVHIDELYILTDLNSSQIATSILNLEMQNIIKVMPGKMISMLF